MEARSTGQQPMTKVTLHQEKRPTKRAPNHQKWVLRWYDDDGKRRGEVIGVVGKMSRREAEAVRRAKHGGMHHGIVRSSRPKPTTLQELAEMNRAAIETDVKPATLKEYDYAVGHAKAALGQDRLLTSIGWQDVTLIKKHIARRGRSTATIRKTIGTLRAMFNRAMRQGLVESNPFSQHRMPKVQPKQMRIFSREEVACMIEVAGDLWWQVFIQLAVTSGLRKAELLNLMWRDIDFAEQTVTVSAKRAGAFTLGGEIYPILAWSSKSHQQRTVPLPVETLVSLRRLQAEVSGSLYVFLSLARLRMINRRLTNGQLPATFRVVNNLNRQFGVTQNRARRLMAKRRNAPVEDVDWQLGCIHDLRRTYGTWMARVVPIHELKVYLGHREVTTTDVFYLAVSESSAERVRAALRLAVLN